jgi:CHAD domain-containing protein
MDEQVFISYARQDSDSALRLYEDLKDKSDLNPWPDKKNLLPGQTWNLEIRKAIKNSRYFLALFSSMSVQKRGYIQRGFRFALEVLDEFQKVKYLQFLQYWMIVKYHMRGLMK